MRIKTFRNPHGSAKAAMDKWLAGNLWGTPVPLGTDKFHVYGANKRVWHPVNVEFTKDRITVVVPTRGMDYLTKQKSYVRVEYDPDFHGGSYSKVGRFVLLSPGDVEDAFEKLTGLPRSCIVHYSPDDQYDETGRLCDG